MKIENAKTTFFNNKEHYLNFRTQWAKSVQAAKEQSKTQEVSPITCGHHLLYNIFRGVELTRGFTLPNKPGKCENICNQGLYIALEDISMVVNRAKQIMKERKEQEEASLLKKLFQKKSIHNTWSEERVAYYTKSFGITVTIEMIAEIELPSYEELTNIFKEAA